MLIDWFTVGAQALNFLILVWVLKHFLYKPILNAIDAREQRIGRELADADAKKAEAQRERDEFQHKNEEFDQQRAALLTKATEDAKAEGLRLLDEARKAADAASARRQESLRRDALNLNQAISRLTQQEVFAIARQALSELATTSLEERLGEVFTRRLRTMDDKTKADLGEALKKASEPALLRSAFELPAEQRATIQNALNETFSADVHIRFETAPDLVGGVELTTNGWKVAWSIGDYLASLQRNVEQLLRGDGKPQANDAADPKEPKPEVKLQDQAEPKAGNKTPSASEPKAETSPEATLTPKPGVKAEGHQTPEGQPDAGGDAGKPSGVAPQTFTRLHELYEQLGRENVKAAIEWENTEGKPGPDDGSAQPPAESESGMHVEAKPEQPKAAGMGQ